MARYSSVADVQALIKWVIFTATSKVTLTEVSNNFIEDVDVFIDDKISRIYVVPVTNTADIKTLKFISARLAAHEIANVLILQASGDIPKVVNQWYTDAMDRLQEVLNLTIELPNTERAESSTSGIYSYTGMDEDAPDAVWDQDGDKW